jgi:hypothetical protein
MSDKFQVVQVISDTVFIFSVIAIKHGVTSMDIRPCMITVQDRATYEEAVLEMKVMFADSLSEYTILGFCCNQILR